MISRMPSGISRNALTSTARQWNMPGSMASQNESQYVLEISNSVCRIRSC